ncbi:MAG TPA: hypothetical protein PK388_03060 [Kiritimatiellia bacterium]|nr:hypothetical protein [Kiritimatiellia bacterium]
MKKMLMIAALLASVSLALAEGKPQTTCPVMKGSPVRKSLYVDAQGCRIYVCCGGCLREVQTNPAKYVAQLKAEGVELEKAPEAPKAE